MLEDARIELKRVESDVEVVEARITRDSARLQASSSVKDVAALEQELAALKKRQFDLEEIELTVMEKVEQQDAVVGQLGEQAGALQGRMADLEGERDSAMRLIDEERANASANRIGTSPQGFATTFWRSTRSSASVTAVAHPCCAAASRSRAE